ncbi:MAG TPA: LLM class flavin-dependent oxidoreductase [Candidatus Limnocylindrales bacterium]|nr:LLM class flavin-dependent oxidoreductase [Candidatus Limnocylindrales bacterium]
MSVEFWRMGATPVPSVQIERFAREFEAAGWDGFAVGEAHGLLPDPYIVLGRGAAATTTLRLGTAVAVPLRSPLLASSAMATLHGLTSGRTSFSIGRGDGAVKVLKRKPMRVAEFDAYLTKLQAYLRGEEVDVDGVATSMARVYDIDPSLRLPKPMIDVAATGPRTIEVAAKTADGVSFSVGADVERLRRSVELVRDTCNRIGRDFESLRLGSYLQVAVTDDDRSAREAIRGLVVTHARFSGWEPRRAADVSDEAHTTYRHALETMESVYHASRGGVAVREGGRAGEIDFYPHEAGGDDLIDQFAIAGSPEYCAERLQQIIDLGITRLMIGTRAVGVDLDESNAMRIGREVLPLLRH